jgi:hypothetical protein
MLVNEERHYETTVIVVFTSLLFVFFCVLEKWLSEERQSRLYNIGQLIMRRYTQFRLRWFNIDEI